MKKNRCFRLALLLAVLAGAIVFSPCVRADEYVKPSTETILNALVRSGALDLTQDDIIDAYTQVMACDIYIGYYKDEFKWQKIRPLIREQVQKDLATYPTGFRYETVLQLGRYDFKQKTYPFDVESQRGNFNVFSMDRDFSSKCKVTTMKNSASILPTTFKFMLDNPVSITGLPLDQKEGAALFDRMEKDGNKLHIVYARFNVRVTFIAQLDFSKRQAKAPTKKMDLRSQVMQPVSSSGIKIDTRLDSIEYFEDENMTRLIYTFRP